MQLEPLEIDLTGLSLQQVSELLSGKGFKVSTGDITHIWDDHDSFWKGHPTRGSRVEIVHIDNAEAHLLTVKIFNGKQKTLESGQDLHLFHRPPGYPPGPPEWSAITTMNIMR